jgi:hypothetical protein
MKTLQNIFLAAVIFSVMAFGCGSKDDGIDAERMYANADPPKISAGQLFNSYRDNQVGANYQYKDKPVLMTGKVYQIHDGGEFNDISIIFTETRNATEDMIIIARVLESQRSSVAPLKPGASVTLLCIVGGQYPGARNNYISLRSCKVAGS